MGCFYHPYCWDPAAAGVATPVVVRAVTLLLVAVSTLVAVDTGQAVNLVVSVHALISLPIQIAAAMYLLYTRRGVGREMV